MPITPVTNADETTETTKSRLQLNVDWKALAKKTAAITAAALAGAAVTAIVMSDDETTEVDESNVVADEATE